MVNDVFGGAALPASVIAATAVAFPGMVGGANMAGRLVWGPVSDRLGRGATFGAFGRDAAEMQPRDAAIQPRCSRGGAEV
mmetsp:Transcript_18309/g.54173  ORF Transcript_18309/g.54173 Transcript_18309/m.54173 type:complete len:80 (+) Transcript_18309:1490-1729(+)